VCPAGDFLGGALAWPLARSPRLHGVAAPPPGRAPNLRLGGVEPPMDPAEHHGLTRLLARRGHRRRLRHPQATRTSLLLRGFHISSPPLHHSLLEDMTHRHALCTRDNAEYDRWIPQDHPGNHSTVVCKLVPAFWLLVKLLQNFWQTFPY